MAIRFACDICATDMTVYQTIKIETMAVFGPYAAPRQPQVLAFEVCSEKCFLESLEKLKQSVRSQGLLR